MEIPQALGEPQQAGLTDVNINPGLSSPQQGELRKVLVEFPGVFQDTPGKTLLMEHHIITDGEKPIGSDPTDSRTPR